MSDDARDRHREIAGWMRALRADRLTIAGALAFATIVVVYLLPWVTTADLDRWSGGIFLLLTPLWPAIAGFSTRRRVLHPEERRYWTFIAVAFSCFSAATALAMTPWWQPYQTPLTLVYDVLSVVYSLSLVLATAEVPHRPPGWRQTLGTQRLVYAGAAIFGLGMIAYFDISTYYLDPRAFASRVPGYLLFLTLDTAILIRSIVLLRVAPNRYWRIQYSLFVAAAGFAAFGDLLDALNRAGRFLYEANAWDFVWYAIFPPLAIAARIPESPRSTTRSIPIRRDALGTPLLTFALIPPLIHFTLTVVDPGSSAADRPHWLAALITMVALLALARIHENRLERRGRELERDVERTRERLAHTEKLEALGRLAGGVAHDFNNKLAVILGYADHLRRTGSRDPEVIESAEAILGAAEHAARLTSKLLAVGQRQYLVSELLDLDRAIAELEIELRKQLGPAISLEIRRSDSPPLALADRSGFEGAIMNLAENTRDALRASGKGRVRISTEVANLGPRDLVPRSPRGPGLYVRLEFSDDGPGIAADQLARIFEPFYTTKKFGDGSGLGLASVRGYVEQCGGFVTIASSPGEGFQCCLNFPHARATPSGAREIYPQLREPSSDSIRRG